MQAYFDAFSGLSGDMTVGALLDLGAPLAEVAQALAGLELVDVTVGAERVDVGGIAATRFVVATREPPGERDFTAIRALLTSGKLAPRVAERALAVFHALAEAEARIHGTTIDRVHFHEVGAADAIADVVAAAVAMEWLGITTVHVGALPLGSGMVESRHGPLPVPAPATLELLRGYPVRLGDGVGEMVTPTGAALLRGLGAVAGPPADFRPLRIGHGAGTRRLADRPNVLRVVLGESAIAPEGLAADEMLVVECNIDDMSPELYEHVMARLFAAGAVDVALVPVHMKKGRPGVTMQVIVASAGRAAVAEVLFAETTTIGVRSHAVMRSKRARRMIEVATPYGPIAVKIADGDGAPALVVPEYESCRRAAEQHGVALRMVYAAAHAALANRAAR